MKPTNRPPRCGKLLAAKVWEGKMRKVMTCVVLALMVAMAYATGAAETPTKIVVGMEAQRGGWVLQFPEQGNSWFQGDYLWDNLAPQFEKDTGIAVEVHPYADNPAQLMDDDLASQNPPDVILAFASRISRLRPYAADLEAYLPAGYLAKFNPSFLDVWKYDGKLFAIPHVGWTAFFTVDTTIAEQAGALDLLPKEPKEGSADRSWTMDSFKEFLRRVKAANIPDVWGTFLFANGSGGDYWSTYGWLSGFGAKLYENGRVAIDTPQGRDALAFMLWMVEQGYAPPEVAAYSFRELIDGWQKNRFASAGGNVNWVVPGKEGYKGTGVTNGVAATEHKTTYVEWPHVAGMNHAGIMFGPDAVIVIDNGDPGKVRAAVKFATEYLSSPLAHLARMEGAKWSSLLSPPRSSRPGVETPLYGALTDLTASAGVWDMGFGITANSELRDLWARLMQEMFNGKLTPAEVTKRFTTEGNEAIDRQAGEAAARALNARQ